MTNKNTPCSMCLNRISHTHQSQFMADSAKALKLPLLKTPSRCSDWQVDPFGALLLACIIGFIVGLLVRYI